MGLRYHRNNMASEAEPKPAADLEGLARQFEPAGEAGGAPLGGQAMAARRQAEAAAPREAWLRVTLFAALLGAALTVVYAWVLARQDALAPVDASGLASYHKVLVPLLALTVVLGVLALERATVLGMVMLLAGCGLSLAGGGVWLVPAMLLGCTWAARKKTAARLLLGLLLLVPSAAAMYYGVIGGLSFLTGLPAPGLPPQLADPITLAQALAPLELLPVAWLGSWLIVSRR
jgi:hypothetical protein